MAHLLVAVGHPGEVGQDELRNEFEREALEFGPPGAVEVKQLVAHWVYYLQK